MTALSQRCIEQARPVGIDSAIVVERSLWVEDDNRWILELAVMVACPNRSR